MKNYEILRAAAEHLGEVGLYQGGFYQYPNAEETSPCCGWGAVIHITKNNFPVEQNNALFKMDDRASKIMNQSSLGYIDYNDFPGRTEEEVITFMLELAQELEDEQNNR